MTHILIITLSALTFFPTSIFAKQNSTKGYKENFETQIQMTISKAQQTAIRYGLKISPAALTQNIEDNKNAFQSLKEICNRDFNKTITPPPPEKINKIDPNKKTPLTSVQINKIESVLKDSFLAYKLSSFYFESKDYSLPFLKLSAELDRVTESQQNITDKIRLLKISGRLSSLILNAAIRTTDYIAAFAASQLFIKRVKKVSDDFALSPQQVSSLLNLLAEINLAQALYRSFNGDLILFLYYLSAAKKVDPPNEYLVQARNTAQYLTTRTLLVQNTTCAAISQLPELEHTYNTITETDIGSRFILASVGSLIPIQETLRLQHLKSRLMINLALKKYHTIHNIFPQTLTQLTPEILKQVPDNPMTCKPFKYTLTEGGKYELEDG